MRKGRVKAALRPHAAWWVQQPPCQGRNRLVGAIWKLLRCQSPRRQAHPTPLKSALISLRSYRSCLGIIRLADRFGRERLDAACARAVTIASPTYKTVEALLKKGLEKVPLPGRADPTDVDAKSLKSREEVRPQPSRSSGSDRRPRQIPDIARALRRSLTTRGTGTVQRLRELTPERQ